MAILFSIFLWILLAIGFGGIMVYYVQAEIYCGQMVTSTDASSVQEAINSTVAAADCFPYVDTGEGEERERGREREREWEREREREGGRREGMCVHVGEHSDMCF